MSLIQDLLKMQTQQTPAQQAPTARTGLQLLLNEAQRTAGMFGNQVGRVAGVDNRPQSVKDMEQILAIVQSAPGATEAERIQNSISAISEINPTMATALQERARKQGAKQGIAQRLTEQGHDDLAAAYLSGEMTADQVVSEARQRRTAEERSAGGRSGSSAPNSNEIKFFTGIATQSPDITSKLESMAERENAGWLYNFTGGRFGSEGDIKEGSKENLISVAGFRAKEIRTDNPELGIRQAFQQAVNEMYNEFSKSGKEVETGTRAVETNEPIRPEASSTFGKVLSGREAARALVSAPIGSVQRVQLPNGNRINIRLNENGQVVVLPNSATEEDKRLFEQSLQSLGNN